MNVVVILSDKNISTCLIVMNAVVIGVVVLGMEVGCEVKWEVGEKLGNFKVNIFIFFLFIMS